MARKNIFSEISEPASNPDSKNDAIANQRPLANLSHKPKRAGPVGAFSSSLGKVSIKAQRVDELEEQLKSGQTVVELDPERIDSSFVIDRLGVSKEDEESLVSQIREQGQKVPILVRPSPDHPGRYQVAYGHRRLAATRKLGIKVQAVIRDLDDEQLIVNQGQENNARTNLSFIERAYFALRLEKRGFSRDVIMSALGVDKAALSRLISTADKLPAEIVEAIGPAPMVGRVKWNELTDLLQETKRRKRAIKRTNEPDFLELASDHRFHSLLGLVQKERLKPRSDVWKASSGLKLVAISESKKKLNLSFDKSADEGFGTYIETKLEELYADYQRYKDKE